MKAPGNGYVANSVEGGTKAINSELWHACAGPLVSLPPVGSLVVYFPQGHSEQVAASMQKQTDGVPSYPNLPCKLICMLHNVTLHADPETDEVYAQMTLQPVNKYNQEAVLLSDMGLKQSRQPAEFFCKTLTASDTSTHGGFSVPRRAAEKIFPPLDFSMQPPAQELIAKDLHDQTWTFKHIYRGQPKRHLLTTGWSVFVSSKRLTAGDSVLFIRDEKSRFLLGIRRASRQPTPLSSSVISSDSMHIGILAAGAHAASNNSPFTIFYNPRASPSEFVIPLAKYNKAMYTPVSLGMRFRMMFETEESGVRRYMGTITSISDLDPVRWKGSQWRNLQVGWDESTAGERPSRVSIWEIEPVVTPFYICPPPFFGPKFSKRQGYPDEESDVESLYKRGIPWIGDEFGQKDPANTVFPGLSLVQWMNMQQNNMLSSAQSGMLSAALNGGYSKADDHTKLLNFQSPTFPAPNFQFGKVNQQNHQVNNHLQQSSLFTHQQQQQQQPQVSKPPPQQPLLQQCLPHMQQQKQYAASSNMTSVAQHNQIQNQKLQSPCNPQPLQNITSGSNGVLPLTSVQQNSQPQPHMELGNQSGVLQKGQQLHAQLQQASLQLLQQKTAPSPLVQQVSHQNLLEQQQLQLQLLQKQQQQQVISPVEPRLEPEQTKHHHSYIQNWQYQHTSLPQQQLSGNSFTMSTLVQSPRHPVNHSRNKSPVVIRGNSGLVEGDIPSCSTSPSTNNCHVSSSKFPCTSQPGPATLVGGSAIDPATALVQDFQTRSDSRAKYEMNVPKGAEETKFRRNATENLDATSSVTSYLLDNTNGFQSNFALPTLCLDGDIHLNSRSNVPFNSAVDSLAPDALLSRGYESGKDIQNVLSNFGDDSRDIETELSATGFGVPHLSFKPSCSNSVAIDEAAGILNNGLWPNQTQRMRTFTKVQKRGSVGRTIDVTRYKGYDELSCDLARMFGLEGQLEDLQRSEWKLVYVDHENDILLVGDDPWEEFVSCVQSIKILSSTEVQQMSLEGNLPNLSFPNQACSGTDSGNAWKGHYDDNSEFYARQVS